MCLSALNPTMNLQVRDVKAVPLLSRTADGDIDFFVAKCIAISKLDWDSFETSWDFKRHPLL